MASISPPASPHSRPATEYYPPLPQPKGAALRGIIFGLSQENRILSRHAHVTGPCIAFRHEYELCFPANFCDFLTIKHVNVHAHTESRPVEYWRVHHSQHRKRCLLSYTSPYFRPNSLDDAS